MKALLPGNGLTVLRNEMDRLFDRIWEGDLPERRLGEWTPVLDFSETKEFFFVKMEVPGMDPKEIQLSLEDHLLTLKGEKKQEKEEKDEHYYRSERSYGAFVRTVRLPATVDGSKVQATFKNGLLKVTLPKAATAKGTTIPIKAE